MKRAINGFTMVSVFVLGASMAYAEPSAHDMPGARKAQWADKHFKEMDANGDGTISKAEFDDFHTKHFQEIDADKDGKLTREEMREGHKEKREQAKDGRFDEVDADHDGVLSREEAKKMPRMTTKRFDKMDANKDGKLSREEMEASMEKMRRKRD